MTWRFVLVSLSGLAVVAALVIGAFRIRPLMVKLNLRVLGALPVVSGAFLVGLGAWLWFEAHGAGEARGTVAALLLSGIGVLIGAAMWVGGSLASQVQTERGAIEGRLEARTRELREALAAAERSHAQLRALIDVAEAMPFEYSLIEGKMTWSNPEAAARLLGVSLAGMPLDEYVDRFVAEDDREGLATAMAELLASPPGTVRRHEYRVRTVDGQLRSLRVAATVLFEGAQPTALRGYAFDVTTLRRLEADLLHAQKLEAIGVLAAGLAHEINTPAQYVGDSIGWVRDALPPVFEAVGTALEELEAAAPDRARRLRLTLEDADLEYARTEAPRALDRALEGSQRIAEIVRAMKAFSKSERTTVDLQELLRNTLLVAGNRVADHARVRLDFAAMPLVRAHAGDLGQVFLNLLTNAADACASKGGGQIVVSISERDGGALVSVSDDGPGITAEAGPRVFDPFFTTKPVGRGSGQGLSQSRRIVLEGHQGKLWFDTRPGEGTTFYVWLPFEPAAGN
jgi:PAS domain S-box-containing protein